MADKNLIRLENVYILKNNTIIIKNVNLSISQGEFVCIYGRSGAGKTSLLRTIAGLERPHSGRVIVKGVDLSSVNEKVKSRLRLESIGYIPQEDNVIDQLKVLENIMLPIKLKNKKNELKYIKKMIDYSRKLGMYNLLDRWPFQLSGGQRRRVSILRALVKDPEIVIADEPLTGLDDSLIPAVYELFLSITNRGGIVIYATPDRAENPPCTKKYIINNNNLQILVKS